MKYEVIHLTGPNSITLDNGQTLYDLIKPYLLAGQEIELDFSGVRIFASPFLMLL